MAANPQHHFDPATLPIAHLESLKFKCQQLIESIQALQRTIEFGGQNYMPPWPDILSKYNVLVSQSLNLSNALLAPLHGSARLHTVASADGGGGSAPNAYERIALHSGAPMTDAQLDNEVIPLLRNQQTTEVLRLENATVRRLAEHMATTRGSLGVLQGQGLASSSASAAVGAGGMGFTRKIDYEDVLRECEEIRVAHDQRADRALRAVIMLRGKFELKTRLEVATEEPDGLLPLALEFEGEEERLQENGAEGNGMEADAVIESPDGSDVDEVEGELVHPTTSPATIGTGE